MKRTEIKRDPAKIAAWLNKPRKPMNRTTPLHSGPGPQRGSRGLRQSSLTPEQRARKKAEWTRAYGSKERVQWIKSRRCFGCRSIAGCENAHLVSGGMGRKADAALVIPLCHLCHAEQHRVGNEAFARSIGETVDSLFAAAAAYEAEWQAILDARPYDAGDDL